MDDAERTDTTQRRCPSRDRKRKSRSEEDTSSRDSSQLEPVKSGRKQKRNNIDEPKKFGFKCSPLMLFDFIKQLSPEQNKWLDETGFGALRLMPEARLPRELSLWLIGQVDGKKKALVLDGSAIDIRKCIKRLLNIPSGDLPVPAPRGTNSKIRSTTGEEKELKDADSGRGNSCANFMSKVLALSEPVKFKRWCMFVILCLYLAPASGLVINRNYMTTLANMDVISQMDWCTFVVDYLIEGVMESRRSTATNVMVHGCIHILLLIYASVVKSRVIHIPKEGFVADHVTTIMLEQLQSIDKKISKTGGITFGLLDVDTSVFEDCICTTEPPTTEAVHTKSNIPSSSNLNSLKLKVKQSSPVLPGSSRASNPSESSIVSQDDIDKIEAAYHREKYAIYRKSNKALNRSLKKLDARKNRRLENLRLKSSQNLEHSPTSMAVDNKMVDSGGSSDFVSKPTGDDNTGDVNKPTSGVTITPQSPMPIVAGGGETVLPNLPTEVLVNESLTEINILDCPHEMQPVIEKPVIMMDKSQDDPNAAGMVDSVVRIVDELNVSAEITPDPVDTSVENGDGSTKTLQEESISVAEFREQSTAIPGGSQREQSLVDKSSPLVGVEENVSVSCTPPVVQCVGNEQFAAQQPSPIVSANESYTDNTGSHGSSIITDTVPSITENSLCTLSMLSDEQHEANYADPTSRYKQGVDRVVYRDQQDLDISDYDDMHGVALIGTESIADIEAFKKHKFCSSLREEEPVSNVLEQDQLSLPSHTSSPNPLDSDRFHDNVCASASSKQVTAANISMDEHRGNSSETDKQHNQSCEAADTEHSQDSNGSSEDSSGDEGDDVSCQQFVLSDEDGTQTD